MRNFFILILAIISIHTVVFAQNQNDINSAAMNMISFYEKVATCTPAQNNGMKIIAKNNSQCRFIYGTIVSGGKEYPLKNCVAPMSAMRTYANKNIAILQNFISTNKLQANYNSSLDELDKYCK